ncbi:MAG: YfhO family protein [Chloroflexi bacterium]|nr:YfhO family protein [Chloroflexota bacterium]
MHAALEVQDPAHPEQSTRTLTEAPSTRWGAPPGEAWLWLAGLLLVISLSVADGVLTNAVAYERDTSVFYFPLMSWLGQQLRSGTLPLWTPQFFGGYPIFADGEIGLAYPPVLLALLTLPPERAFITLRLLHLALAACGMFFLARTWRLPYQSAVLAGIVFSLGNFLQAQIHHENIVRTASWLPLILACVEKGLRAAVWRSRLRWTALGAICLGLAGLSLHSQVLAIELLILTGYGAFRWGIGPLGELFPDVLASGAAGSSNGRLGVVFTVVSRRRWLTRLLGVASVCLPVVVCGLGLAAVQLVPLVELASFSARGNGIPYDQAAAYSVTPYGLLQLVFPYFFRGPGSLQWGLWTHWESYVYIGLVPLVLAVVALVCARRREVVGWAVFGTVGLVLSLGQYSPINVHYLLWLLPGLSGLRAPGRFTFVVMLAGAMLAAYGLAWLMTGADDSLSRLRVRRVVRSLVWTTLALTLLLGVLHVALLIWPLPARSVIDAIYLSLPRDTYPLSNDDVFNGLAWSTNLHNPRVLVGLAGLAAIAAAIWLWQVSPWRRWRAWRGWPNVFLALAAIDLLTFGWAIHPRESLATISAEPAAVRQVEQLPAADGAPNRVLASPVLNQVAADRLAPFGTVQEANGYSSLQFIWHRDYLGRVLYADDALLDLWDVRYILDPARFGKLSSFGGVQYLPQQALLHAPAGGALAQQSFTLTGQSPIVEMRLVTALVDAVQVPQGAPVAELELRDGSNSVIATAELQAGRDSMDWAWDVPSVRAAVQHQHVQVAGTTIEDGGPPPRTRSLSFSDFMLDPAISASTLTIRAVAPAGEFVLYGAGLVGSDGSITQLFGKTDTKYRQVYADDEMRVLENTAAFPRAFVVPTARVAPSLGSALSQMIHQPFQPDQEVILADDTTTQATGLATDRGGHGTARIAAYAPDDVRVHTSADADAWLVLSDTYYPGWTATVDGQPAAVLRGDVLFRVVPVPGGEHDVELQFEPSTVRIGLAISLACLVCVLAALGLAGRPARRRRTT